MQQHFLGWSQAFIISLADFLIENHPNNLSDLNVILPSKNAGRNLVEAIKKRSDEKEVKSPNIYSLGELPDLFLPVKNETVANSYQSLNAWVEEVSEQDLSALFPSRTNTENPISFFFSVAQTIQQLHTELSSASLTFQDVLEHLEKKQLSNSNRWSILEEIKQKYLSNLRNKGLVDRYQRRIDAKKNGETEEPNNLFLCSCYDINPLASELINTHAHSKNIWIVIFAPENHKEGFHIDGAIKNEYWTNKKHIFPNQILSISEKTLDQAKEIFEAANAISENSKKHETIKIGIPGSDIVPALKATFASSALSLRNVSGKAITTASVYSLLHRINSFIKSDSYKSFASLFRHAVVAKKFKDEHSALIKKIDTYYNERLPRSWSSTSISKELKTFTEECKGYKSAKNLLQSLEELFNSFYPAEERSLEIKNSIESLLEVGVIVESDNNVKTFENFLSRILLLSKSIKLTEEKKSNEIEMMGWLELALDPSAYLLLSGMNDTNIPGLDMTNPFLNETLRQELGLKGENSKIARDCFIFETMLNSKKLIHLFASKKSLSDDPQMLCRLLLKDDKKIISERTLSFYGESKSKNISKDVSNSDIFTFPKPTKGTPLEKIRVSAFRDYLYCPYLFYLKHIKKIESIDDLEAELSPSVYGTLTHKILESLPANKTLNQEQINLCIEQSLNELIKNNFGKNTLPAVLIQLELLKQRLNFFIEWQSRQFQEGWCIWEKEYSFRETPLVLKLENNLSLKITGSIDRIDFNQNENKWRIIDYKTSESPIKISSVYTKKTNEWEDLQLPLYAEYALRNIPQLKESFEKGNLEIAYVNISKDFKNSSHSSIIYTQEMRDSAMELAKTTASYIVEEDYQPMNSENWLGRFKDLLPEASYAE